MIKTKQPNPGHSEAVKLGCTCPVLDNNHGIGCGKDEKGQTRFWIREDCPLHGLVAQMVETNKLRCRECYWKGEKSEALKAANPFQADELIYGCPECKQINMLIRVCDEKGCWRCYSCGFVQADGVYRNTCSEHSNFNKNP